MLVGVEVPSTTVALQPRTVLAALAVGVLAGHGPDAVSWPVGVAWVAVWTTTAWINARMAEKLLRRGWDALRTAPRKEDDDDWSEDWYGDPDDRHRT